MKFTKGTTYNVASINHDHMVIAVNKKGLEYIAEPTTRNDIIGRIDFEDDLEYVGRVAGKPTFKLTKDGKEWTVAGHSNNFDLDAEYNQDKLRTRSEENRANTKTATLVKSADAMDKQLIDRDPVLAEQRLEAQLLLARQAVQDLAVDRVLEEEEAEAVAA